MCLLYFIWLNIYNQKHLFSLDYVLSFLVYFFVYLWVKLQTDTASVLQEAIEYIKFLHDQVTVRFL